MWLADAQRGALELAERCSIPVVKTMMGLGLLPTDHPLNMGMIGAHGNHCANKALAKADLLIMVGTRAADRAMVDPGEIQRRMATIHIDVDPAEIGKNMQAAIPLVGNVKVILRQILDRDVAATDSAAWLEKLRDYRKAELNRVFPRRAGSVFPGTVLRRLGAGWTTMPSSAWMWARTRSSPANISPRSTDACSPAAAWAPWGMPSLPLWGPRWPVPTARLWWSAATAPSRWP